MNPKDSELLNQLIEKTNDGTLTWEDTAMLGRFVATLGGKVSFVLDEGRVSPILRMRDALDRDLLELSDDMRLQQLYDKARRQALHVDETLDAVIAELRSK